MTPELKPRADLAADIGERVIDTANSLRLYMDETFTAKFPFIWDGRRFNVMIEMEGSDEY
jgi:hypothetical protein